MSVRRASDAEDRYRLAMRLLRDGDYERGWSAYEARSEWSATGVQKPALPWPEWRGEDLTGKRLLVWPEQGLGDKIMFGRYLPLLGAGVTVLCEPALVRLFRENFAVEVVPATGRTEFPDPDYWVMYGSLPHVLGLSVIPAATYLSARPLRAAGTVGVCVAGSAQHPNDGNRSLFGEDARALLSLPGAVDLSPESTGAGDFLDTAEIIAALDAVITVDTSVAHLAGAMGKPVSILLPSTGTDWRWGRSGERTPWYPTARLVRQRLGEPWADVVSRVSIGAPAR